MSTFYSVYPCIVVIFYEKGGKQMKKRKKALSFSAAVLLGATLTATSMSNIVFAENTFSHSINTEDTSYIF